MADYLSKTGSLSILEHGAYNLMLDAYYSSEKPLPADYKLLYRLCRAMSASERAAVKSVADAYFPVGQDGMRHNERADKELAVAKSTIEKQRISGVEAANKRWGNERKLNESTHRSTHRSIDGSEIQPSTTNHQPLTVNHQPPASNHQPSQPLVAAASAASTARQGGGNGSIKPEAPTSKTWAAYTEAYQHRHGVEPVRNRQMNSMMKQFVERIGVEESPGVAAFYVVSNRGLYVSAKHPVNLLLRDAESLRTEWATGNQGTETQARSTDKTAAIGNVFGKLIAETEAKGKKHGDPF